jgi:preprotein translocase subunit SecD
MTSNLKYRVGLILGLIAISIWALWPRTVKERVRQADGSFAYVDVKRIPLKQGLDLKGGMQLTLEVDETKGAVADKAQALENALRVIRNRVDEFGVAEPVVQKVGEERIFVELPGVDDPQRAQEVVQKAAFLEFQIVDETGALDKALPRLDAIVKERGGAVATSANSDATRSQGVTSLFAPGDTAAATADSAAGDSAVASVPGAQGGPFSKMLQQGQIPGQYFIASVDVPTMQSYLALPEVQGALPPGKVVRFGADSAVIGGQGYRPLYVLDSRPIITGEYIQDAKPNTVPIEGNVVEFQLNNEGGRRFKNETARHIKDYMAIVLDQRVMSAPVIQSAIGNRGQITMGGSDLQEAQDLALVLRAGSLPVPLRVEEVRTIGPSLGQDAIDQGIRAGLVGLLLVVVIMVVYYRFSGVLAVVGLLFYALTTLAFLAAFGATLTLPGIAGFVLSIGMAVDANFLQFERIREELDAGKSPRAAIDEGFKNSFAAIVDTHVTTALTAAVLYQYGTGPVQGFAVTLMAGVASSMVSSVFVVRTLFLLWLNRTRGAQTVSI